mmetsp:Transcript_32111/g.70284  ORF Transcript_32111/g.70284 Transcript_32111/m.70284 type:complete len:165 (-) Transcript_32111:92-586(-)|eukprot:CAMPEP_0170630986 /NCGR_PEP_ID=MMETSP0224-20130122/34337_1 /TAXON_ID=285029 /ORGANISM="Togula jolla, Strain CCCM 725" /LENGTH=164 /DNA_ID=CAMNT_0010959169 /DNA_START=1 /DNA_END=495 /DNA_ORIENTATION=-
MAGMFDIQLPEAGADLTREQLEKVQDNFRLMDRNRDGFLDPEETSILFRAFGQNPTDEELTEMLRTIPPSGLDEDGFVAFFSKNYRPPASEESLVRAFQVFDLEDCGNMSAEKFKEMLTSLGEPMAVEEVEAILKEAEMNDRGSFDYKKFATRLVEGPKRIPEF